MSLEGPRLSSIAKLRARFGLGASYTAQPKALLVFAPAPASSTKIIVSVIGAIAGGWLAGTTSGQSFIRRIRGK